jgi:hypothetical protein
MSEKTVLIETIDTNGPVEKEYSVEDAMNVINSEKRNNKTVFINGSPYMSDFILEKELKNAKTITIMNQLIGG